ncbi:MAG: ABC transporter substrate-binding protein [Anaerolineae bacterium]
MFRKLTWLMAVALLLGVVVAACVPVAPPAPTEAPAPEATPAPDVVIGLVYPLTGSLARTAEEIRDAMELVVDIVNEAHPELAPLPLAATEGLPNLGGAKIKLVFGDSRGEPETGRAEAERLIEQEGAQAIVGSYQSSVTGPASAATEARGIVFLNPESSSPTLTERGLNWFFRTGPHDGVFTSLFFDFLEDMKARGIDVGDVAILSEDTEFGVTASEVEKELAGNLGYNVVGEELYTSPPASIDAELLRLRDNNPNVLFGQNYVQDAVLIIQTLKEIGYFPDGLLVHDAGWVQAEFLETVGADSNYVISRAAWSLDLAETKPIVKAVNDLYQKRTSIDLTGVTARGITGLLTLVDAINRAGSTDPEAVRQALLETDLSPEQTIMPFGVKFDPETHQNILAKGVLEQRIDEEWRLIYPFEVAAVDVVWPAPGWDER